MVASLTNPMRLTGGEGTKSTSLHFALFRAGVHSDDEHSPGMQAEGGTGSRVWLRPIGEDLLQGGEFI